MGTGVVAVPRVLGEYLAGWRLVPSVVWVGTLQARAVPSRVVDMSRYQLCSIQKRWPHSDGGHSGRSLSAVGGHLLGPFPPGMPQLGRAT